MYEYYLNKLYVYFGDPDQFNSYQTRFVDYNFLSKGDTVFVKDIFCIDGYYFAYVIINKARDFDTTEKMATIIFLDDLNNDKSFRLVKI